ncbi:MAG: cation-efflux pump [Clostridiales bacterium 38-18]|nr:MAG: cation-efflux pump [Clostridiales bacterium 38-18]
MAEITKKNNNQDYIRAREAKKVTLVGFVINVILTIFKLFAGVQGKSAAMLADGIHSLSDFFTDIVVLVGFKFTEKPEDEDHNYGHGKYETLATVVIGIALFLVGYKIFSSGLSNIYGVLFKGMSLSKPTAIALIAAISSIISKELLFRYTKVIGEKINSSAVIANGWHHRSDAFSSIGTLIGISGAMLLGHRWTILDPIASVVVSFFIFKVAFEILMPAIKELTEVSLSEAELSYIENTIKSCNQILNYHHLRTRKIGNRVAIEVHLMFDKGMTLFEAHEHASEIESEIKSHFGAQSIITTHLEPN